MFSTRFILPLLAVMFGFASAHYKRDAPPAGASHATSGIGKAISDAMKQVTELIVNLIRSATGMLNNFANIPVTVLNAVTKAVGGQAGSEGAAASGAQSSGDAAAANPAPSRKRRETAAAAPPHAKTGFGAIVQSLVDAINNMIQIATGTISKFMEIPKSFINGLANGAGMGGQGAAQSGTAPSGNAAPANPPATNPALETPVAQ